MSRNLYSIVEYHSKQERNSCGYCRSPNTSYSHGMTTQLLTVQHYQSLIDRGWRRSGCYCYKPMMKRTCCPHYTIKCDALDFKLSKSQKKILKRMVKFLKNELSKEEEKKASRIGCDEDIVRGMEIPDYSMFTERADTDASKMQVTSVSEELSHRLNSTVDNTNLNTSTSKPPDKIIASTPTQPMETSSNELRRANFDSTRAPQKKAKQLRIERKQQKLLAQGKTMEEINAIMKKNRPQNTGKTLEDFFDEIGKCSNKLELRLVRTSPPSDGYKKNAKESFQVYKKYQTSIHGDKLSKLSEERYARFLVRSPLRMKLVRVMSEEFLETLDKSAKLYKKYQMTIHKDKPKNCDKRAFFDFLVRSPLQQWIPEDGPPAGYGSFHEQYWLNGVLIAVAVIDILPSCVSSVYFFYDPAYSYLSLGTFSSLREVFLTRQLNKYSPDLKYYYMGYYIHSCMKMRYKAKMRPSKLLCPETYVWCDIDKCLPKLDASKYSRLNEDLEAVDENGEVDTNQVLILYHNKAMMYGVYRRHVQNEVVDNEIKEYAPLVGKQCALNMLYFID
ncbi:arginyl-tRNA--protein transferase 1 isoform X1 [Nasonia vitripennis]|uniref:Arginyl-tRNA--protein transferase 1 n=1 Tax=Nasonia vitripennis TaxID=7425 RepID=A0A7M7IV49_NASVI|nr:arginyl-tRNA--protein transferase 1 isoform X1 [Nasonia vitripennis]